MPRPEDMVRDLREVIANLTAYVHATAEEIAAPQIAAACEEAEQRVAEAESRLGMELQRQGDLVAELRRQLDVQIRMVESAARDARSRAAMDLRSGSLIGAVATAAEVDHRTADRVLGQAANRLVQIGANRG